MNGCDDVHSLLKPKFRKEALWSEDDICKLVRLYKNSPCLWRKDIPAYADNIARHRAYRSIHQSLNMPRVTFTDVMMKIRETRRLYLNELIKSVTGQVSGCMHKPEQTWFTVMHEFLHRYLDYDESAELHDAICSMGWNVGLNDYKRILKSLNLDDLSPPSAGDPRSEEQCSNSRDVRKDKSPYSVSEEECLRTNWLPQSKDETFSPSCSPTSISRHRNTAVSLLDKTTCRFSRVEHRSPPMSWIHSARNKDSPLSDYCSENSASNLSKSGVQFSLYSDSLLSEKSSSTTVCETWADYTCNPEKKLTSCGVQWNSLESKVILIGR
ncbi:uncharacterized protein LOC124308146 [Neodiprion virginianus]|uniref:uncharacterized protein LOC124308146 n=1 Tax=Neodiprion virginianus TaxID=2961670 RepID=UPI001EE69581|nr:uncharacterized protein LOC124308146 [Neodiprion virginianus]